MIIKIFFRCWQNGHLRVRGDQEGLILKIGLVALQGTHKLYLYRYQMSNLPFLKAFTTKSISMNKVKANPQCILVYHQKNKITHIKNSPN